MRTELVGILIVLATGCGGGSGGDSGADARPGQDGGAGVDAEDIDETIDPTPVLERTPRIEATCAVEETLEVVGSSWGGAGMVATPSGPAIAYVSAEGTRGVHVAPLATSPAIGLGTDYEVIPAAAAGGPLSTASRGDSIALAWTEGFDVETVLKFARVSTSGALLSPAVTVPGVALANTYQPVELIAREGGWAIAWIGGSYPDERLRFVRLDDAGTPVGTASDLDAARGLGSIVARDGGFLVAYAGLSGGRNTEARTILLDADGAAIGGPRRVSPASDDERSYGELTLLPQGDGYLAAWTETFWDADFDRMNAHDVVQLGRLDASGGRIGPIHRLQAPVEDVSNRSPELFVQGDHVGLTWSSGSIIYICGGCMPDHVLRLLTIDPDDLVPTSAPIELVGDTGLFTTAIQVIEDRIVALFALVYHVHSDAAAAVLRCQ